MIFFPQKILAEKITPQKGMQCKANSFFYAMLHLNGLKNNPLAGQKNEFIKWFLDSTASAWQSKDGTRCNNDIIDATTKRGFSSFVLPGYSISSEVPAVNKNGEIIPLIEAQNKARLLIDKLFSDPQNTALIFDNNVEHGEHSYVLFAHHQHKQLYLVDTLKYISGGLFADEPIPVSFNAAVSYIISDKYVVDDSMWQEGKMPFLGSHRALYNNKKCLVNKASGSNQVLVEPDTALILRKMPNDGYVPLF